MQTVAEETVADENDRRLFLVEHDLRGLSSWQLATVHRALGEAVRRENQRGGLIRYVRSRSYLPFVLYRFVLAALVFAVLAARG